MWFYNVKSNHTSLCKIFQLDFSKLRLQKKGQRLKRQCFFQRCNGIRSGIKERRDRRGDARLVFGKGFKGLFCRLSLPLLRPTSSRRHSRARLETQNHGLCHALSYQCHAWIYHQGKKQPFLTNYRILPFNFFLHFFKCMFLILKKMFSGW